MYEIKALLTDLDGTLIHSVDPICDALHQCFIHVGATPPSKQAIIDMFGLPVEVMLTTLSEVTEDQQDRIDEFIAEYKRQYPVHMVNAKIISGAMETMEYFYNQGAKICLITSERRKNAQHILDALGFNRYIKYLISRDDVTHFKPHPEPLLNGLKILEEDVTACAYIGESPFDIQAGVKSGVFTVGVPSGNWSEASLQECNPDLMIATIEQLKDILKVK